PGPGVDVVLLLDPDPGQIATRFRNLLVLLRLLGLELRELVPGRLPFLAGSDPVFRHVISSCPTPALACAPNPQWRPTPTRSQSKTPDDVETHRNVLGAQLQR